VDALHARAEVKIPQQKKKKKKKTAKKKRTARRIPPGVERLQSFASLSGAPVGRGKAGPHPVEVFGQLCPFRPTPEPGLQLLRVEGGLDSGEAVLHVGCRVKKKKKNKKKN
jgi:hypothetical protein